MTYYQHRMLTNHYSVCHLQNIRPQFTDMTVADLKWKHDFLLDCLYPVLDTLASAQSVPYSHIIALDAYIRDHDVPLELDMFGPDGLSLKRPLIMQQAMVASGHEIGLCTTISC